MGLCFETSSEEIQTCELEIKKERKREEKRERGREMEIEKERDKEWERENEREIMIKKWRDKEKYLITYPSIPHLPSTYSLPPTPFPLLPLPYSLPPTPFPPTPIPLVLTRIIIQSLQWREGAIMRHLSRKTTLALNKHLNKYSKIFLRQK